MRHLSTLERAVIDILAAHEEGCGHSVLMQLVKDKCKTSQAGVVSIAVGQLRSENLVTLGKNSFYMLTSKGREQVNGDIKENSAEESTEVLGSAGSEETAADESKAENQKTIGESENPLTTAQLAHKIFQLLSLQRGKTKRMLMDESGYSLDEIDSAIKFMLRMKACRKSGHNYFMVLPKTAPKPEAVMSTVVQSSPETKIVIPDNASTAYSSPQSQIVQVTIKSRAEHNLERAALLLEATAASLRAGKNPPSEWLIEYFDIIDSCGLQE